MIDFQQVGRNFGGKHRTPRLIALQDVTLSIAAGERWGVVGPNGAGKSTLFAVLLGFLAPSRGTIRIAGLEPRDYTREQGAGYLPERFRLPSGWTVRSGLHALASLDGVPHAETRTEETLSQFGLLEHADKTVGTLSRGLLQRVGLAQALLAQRNLIVFDEPTEGLDPLWRLRFRELVSQLRTEQHTVLIASHDLGEIERLVDHVVLLEGGRIRDSFRIAPPADGPRRYRIALQAPLAQVNDILGEIEQVDDGRAYTVLVRDTNDLSARLAALLALGAVIESVQPADGLEERVRAALRKGSDS